MTPKTFQHLLSLASSLVAAGILAFHLRARPAIGPQLSHSSDAGKRRVSANDARFLFALIPSVIIVFVPVIELGTQR